MSADPEYVRYSTPAGHSVQSPLDISYSHSVNTVPSVRDIISEELSAGQRVNGRMSNVRRFFCLFVTFDFLLTSLMWIICVMLNGEFLIKALTEQVLHYNIQTSLFDIVLVAFCRFFVLTLFYALLYINHWIIIALSTASTCGFLITKVFYFDWPHSSQPVFEVLLVLTSFILAWVEAWFLDFRVIPQEYNANRYIVTADAERAPLIRSYVQGLPSMYTESVGNFYSPQGTPEGSLFRYEQSPSYGLYPSVRFSREQEENYRVLAVRTLQDAWDLFQKKDWRLQKQNESDVVYIRADPKGKKTFKLCAQLDVSPRYLLEELYFRIQDMPKWNSLMKESHKVQALDEHTDIVYQTIKEAIGGLVASRDFVTLRHWAHIENCYVISHVHTDHPSVPLNKKIIRGENGVGCMIIENTGDMNKCKISWILNVDLKMWIPGNLFEKEMAQMMFKYVSDLRKYISEKRDLARSV